MPIEPLHSFLLDKELKVHAVPQRRFADKGCPNLDFASLLKGYRLCQVALTEVWARQQDLTLGGKRDENWTGADGGA